MPVMFAGILGGKIRWKLFHFNVAMLTQKVFIRKTKRGNILKIVREHYLREDIGCGSGACQKCDDSYARPLQKDFESASEVVKHPHYVVPDTNIVFHQVIWSGGFGLAEENEKMNHYNGLLQAPVKVLSESWAFVDGFSFSSSFSSLILSSLSADGRAEGWFIPQRNHRSDGDQWIETSSRSFIQYSSRSDG